MQYKVDTTKLRQSAEEVNSYSGSLTSIYEKVEEIRSGCAISGSAKDSILSALKTIEDSIEQEAESVKSMGTALESISRLYQDTEENIIQNRKGNLASQAATAGAGAADASVAGAQKTAEKSSKKSSKKAKEKELKKTKKAAQKAAVGAVKETVDDIFGFGKSMFSFCKKLGKGDVVGAVREGYKMINATLKAGEDVSAAAMGGIGIIAANAGNQRVASAAVEEAEDYKQRGGLADELRSSGFDGSAKYVDSLDDMAAAYDVFDKASAATTDVLELRYGDGDVVEFAAKQLGFKIGDGDGNTLSNISQGWDYFTSIGEGDLGNEMVTSGSFGTVLDKGVTFMEKLTGQDMDIDYAEGIKNTFKQS